MLYQLSLSAILFMIVAAFLAGLLDAIAGGGGLIQLPALLIGLPRSEITQVFGTNKLSAVLGTSVSANVYRKQVKFNPKVILAMGLPAFTFSMLGALLASHLPTKFMRPGVAIALALVAIYTWRKPQLGHVESLRHSQGQQLLITAGAGALIGFYDGIFGPGTGSFLMVTLVALLGFSFLSASAIAKFVNIFTNIGALLIFGYHGVILWKLGLVMGCANILGARIGAHVAIKGGSTLVRKVFLCVTVALILKVGYDSFISLQ
jgi:uncharacterized membrane protein YfcA